MRGCKLGCKYGLWGVLWLCSWPYISGCMLTRRLAGTTRKPPPIQPAVGAQEDSKRQTLPPLVVEVPEQDGGAAVGSEAFWEGEFVNTQGLVAHQVPAPNAPIRAVVEHLGGEFVGPNLSMQGKVYTPLDYPSKLSFLLHLQLRDPYKAEVLHTLFRQQMEDAQLSLQAQDRLAQWVVEVAKYLGSPTYFLVNSNDVSAWTGLEGPEQGRMVTAAKAILKELAAVFATQAGQVDPERVMILTTTSGGGHFSVAKAMEARLQAMALRPELLIVDELGDADPFHQLTGRPSGVIFNEIHQKQGNIPLFNQYMQFIHWYLLYYLQNSENAVIRARQQAVRPVATINTMGYTDAYVSTAFDLDTPQLVVSTDFDVWESLDPVVQKSADALIRLGVPARGDTVLAAILQRNPDTGMAAALQEFAHQREQHAARNVVPYLLGYPIRDAIRRLSAAERAQKRQSLGLADSDRVLLVMMGSQGKASLFDIVRTLQTRLAELSPLPQVYIFTGRNEELRGKLQQMIAQAPAAVAPALHVLGMQSAEQINDWYNAADLLISKPGGATAAEVLAVELPLIMYDINEGERQNRAYLEASGLGRHADDLQQMMVLVDTFLQRRPQLDPGYRPYDWRRALAHFIEASQARLRRRHLSELGEGKFVGAGVQSRQAFTYGKFDYYASPTEVSGGVSGFFLYPRHEVKDDAHFELDIEIKGGSFPHLQTNVWQAGVPSEQLHALENDPRLFYGLQKFTIAWQPDVVRFYRNDRLLRESPNTYHQPLHVFMNHWVSDSGWAGELEEKDWDFVHCLYVQKWVYTPWDAAKESFATHKALTFDFDDLDDWWLQHGYTLSATQMEQRLVGVTSDQDTRYLTLKLMHAKLQAEGKELRCVDHIH
ncbi:MAG: family 16 glycosylhydrolase [Zetaproteobacteria bacterium]|nr:family 16 glycosylhydrolase [Zetaproteobacteria bacterium]